VLLIKKIINWFKLYVSFGFIGGSIALCISEYKQFANGFNSWGPIVLFSIILFVIGFLLLLWFIKYHKIYYLRIDPLIKESRFYSKNRRFCDFVDGWSFNGFGTKYFTYSNKQVDESIYATKWLTLAFIPLIPLYQEKIIIVSEKEILRIPLLFQSSKLIYKVIERLHLNSFLIKLTYCFYFLFVIPALVLPIVFLLIYLAELNIMFSGKKFWWVILTYFAWGIFIIFLTELFNKRFFLKTDFN